MRGLENKTVLVAGGAGQIGSATSRRLGEEGANVIVASLREENAAASAEQVSAAGGTAVAIRLDIADESSVVAAFEAVEAEFGGLDAVHVNAANMAMDVIAQDSDVESIDLDVFDRTLQTNLRGSVLVTRHAIPRLRARGGGALVYTSSAAAFVGEPERPAYAVSKSGLHAIVRHVASRWGREGIRANAIAPGPTLGEQALAHMDQSFLDQMRAPVRSPRLGRPEDIAAMVAFLISADGEWVNGQVISVDGGMTLR